MQIEENVNNQKEVKNKKSIIAKMKVVLLNIKNGSIIRKLKELVILLISFGKALVDLFIPQKKDETYISLAPTKNADKDGTYCNALKYAIESKNIRNIAVTGNYGSGKSSVIQTFFDKLENKKYNPIYVSLAAFNKEDYLENNKKDVIGNEKIAEIRSKNEFYHTLEKSILQQLLYQASEKELPLSRFKRISKHSRLLLNIFTISIICSICMLVCLIFPEIINKFINNYNNIKNQLSPKGTNILLGISIIAIYCITYKILFFVSTKFNISKFKIKDAEVQIDNKPESIFNKYLDEIIYFFQVKNHRVVIIEDLDRYEGNASFIFQKLRELNTLINSSNQVKYQVDFVYAIKDDFFNNYEERTKFFDYIIPIIPISSSGNSNEIMWKRLEKLKSAGKIDYKFNKLYIDDVSILIEDKRLIDNIINEFIIYKSKMNNEHMDDRQLFAIMMYKNIFPKDYSELQKNKGNIVDIFSSKNKFIDELIKELRMKRDNLYEEKEIINKEHLKNIKELKQILVSSIYNYTNNTSYERYFQFDAVKVSINEFFSSNIDIDKITNSNISFNIRYTMELNEIKVFEQFGNKAAFIKRWETIKKGKNIKLKELQNEIENIEEEIKKIINLPLKQIINKYQATPLFENSTFIERFLISKGYITEEYRDYITLFVPGNLTKADNEFVFAVKTGEKLAYDFKLENLENIFKRLDENDFEKSAILNFDLLDYLINNNHFKKIIKIIEVLDKEGEKELEFIDSFIKKYNSATEFIKMVTENSEELWKKIYNKLGNKEYVDQWVIHYLINGNALKNTDESFNDYIKEHEDIDKYITDEQITEIINSLKTLGIKLSNIKKISNENFFEQIYLNNLYELNSIMIKNILELKNINIQNFETKNLNIILMSDLDELKEYVIDNFEEYYNCCYTLNNSNEDEEISIIKIIQNEDINFDIRKQIIINEKFSEYNIENINRELITVIIDEDKLRVSYDNILSLVIKDESIETNVINHISSHIQEYKEQNIEEYILKYGVEAIAEFEKKYIFNKNVKMQDFEILVDTFNIQIEEIEECDTAKLEYLINKEKIEFNKSNFEYIKQNMDNMLVEFIMLNRNTFIENIDEYDISSYEEILLNSDKIDNESKKEIINVIDIEKLENSTLIKLMCDDVISNNDTEINKRIFSDANIDIESKLVVINSILESSEDENEVTEYIHLLNNGYEDINTMKNACNIPFTKSNMDLCAILKEKGYISSYKTGKKRNIIIYNRFNK